MLPEPPVVGLVARQTRAVDAALLARADADALTILHIAYGVGLGVLEGDHGNRQVALGKVGQLLVFGDDIAEKIVSDDQFVALLLEGDAEYILALQLFRLIGGVDLDDVVIALALGFEDFEGFRLIAGGDHAVGHLGLDELCGRDVAHVGQGDPVAKAGHAVRAAGARVGAGQRRELRVGGDEVDAPEHVRKRQAHGRAGGADVLEAGGGGQARGAFQLTHQLPAVEGVQKVDIARPAAEHLDGQLAVLHEDARGLLVGIAAIFQFQLVHLISSSPPCLLMMTSFPSTHT